MTNAAYAIQLKEAKNDKDQYQILYDQYFTVEDKEDLNMQAMIKSDFLRSNVNFFFIH